MADASDKLEAALKKLAAQVGELTKGQHELREDVTALGDDLTTLRDDVSGLQGSQNELLAMMKGIQRTQTALTAAMTSAVKELATSRSLDLRVRRLEDAVFGSKH